MYRKFRKLISPYYRHLEMLFKMVYYNIRRERIKRQIKEKPVVTVAFFVVNLAMWKSEDLFVLLKKDNRFKPIIISMPRPWYSAETEQEEQIRLQTYCQSKGFLFLPGYDYHNKKFNGPSEIKPDLVFYSQPYNAGYKVHKIESFWRNALFFYIPYCFAIERQTVLDNTLLQNICEAVFCENSMIKDIEKGLLTNHACNYEVTGSLCYDQLCLSWSYDNFKQIWKQKSDSIKRVIWAPHHSILKSDILNYSNFLNIADAMLELAKNYYGKIQFIFKPHPGLKPKLYNLQTWGRQKTDDYYQAWNELPNARIAEGDYFDIFKTSDALIHDCSSFSVEYLYTHKPVMYITKTDHLSFMNDFGKMCFNLHYKGQSVNDVKHFLEQVVIGGNDYLMDDREAFVSENLLPPNNMSASENIYNYLVKNVL